MADWQGYSFREYNGDGNILYPGTEGPVPSIRLKNIRDGLEDYIYLKMLEDAVEDVKSGKCAAPDGWLKEAEKALAVSPELVNTLTDFSTDDQILLRERNKIAGLIQQIAATQ